MLTPGSTIGRYVVQRKLAEGGMAELYLCTAQGPEGFAKDVVIKQVRSFLASDPGFVQMFISEARLASRLNHANVVQLFDFAKHEDTYFIAMEYVRGASVSELKKRCAAAGVTLPPTLSADLCAQVARGLHHAHTQTDRGQPLEIVHRDVTPQNILLAFDGAVKLTDFGIAKASTTATAPGMLKGKYAYMSPEQARGENVDARSDIFSLGIVLWELLTGSKLFDGTSDVAVLRAVQESAIATPSRLNPEVPEALSAITLRALARERSARYQTAAELERALAQFVIEHARSLEDTRLDAFLRPLFPEELAPPEALEATSSVGLAPTLPKGRQGLGTEPLRTALTASSSPTTPMPQLAPAGAAKTDRQPGLRQSVPRLKEAAERALAPSPTLSGRAPSHRHEVTAARTVDEVPGVPTANMRRSLKVAPVEDPGPEAEPPSGAEAGGIAEAAPAGRRNWAGVAIGAVIFAAAALAALVVTTQTRGAQAATTPPVVEVLKAAPGPTAAPQPEQRGDPAAPDDAPPVAAAPAPGPAAEVPPGPTPTDATPSEAEASKPAPVANGYLDIYAQPFATVRINGRSVGDVQGNKRFPLKPGRYKVELEHPRLVAPAKSVTVRSGEKTRLDFAAPEK